ncbi:MAG: DUF4337 domain-containing protein [Ginsengibacter sp.]
MEDIEVPTDRLHEEINERAKKGKKWSLYLAISTAFMAVLAAIAGLMAGHYSNEALIEQIKASDQWAYYQAKGIKAEIAGISSLKDSALREKYKTEQKAIKETAEDFQKRSQVYLDKHVTLARAVTMFQIAIAISAISILTSKRWLWYFAILLSMAGLVFFIGDAV